MLRGSAVMCVCYLLMFFVCNSFFAVPEFVVVVVVVVVVFKCFVREVLLANHQCNKSTGRELSVITADTKQIE